MDGHTRERRGVDAGGNQLDDGDVVCHTVGPLALGPVYTISAAQVATGLVA
ncbi:MAG: hypothetical protein V2I50_09800 [Desulfuromusa sp.]|jgi:hypothetical protein|nr:hypothetical protein [Desulfuromusa sp.]